jgi:D-3-phosphoglycerate dehydrogenase
VGKNYVFDFDSTLTRVEALDVLAEITLEGNPEKESIIEQIKEITNLGIDGEISFTESLERRIRLLKAHKNDLAELVTRLSAKVSPSIVENKSFFTQYSEDIYVISCGFKEFIDPIVAAYDIPSEKVYANTFTYDQDGYITGFDRMNDMISALVSALADEALGSANLIAAE